MHLTNRTRREGGFTLIELISVIIILGILAAVITPKYFDMTAKANQAAYNGALNEGASRMNLAYSQYVLQENKIPADLTALKDAKYLGTDLTKVDIGDYFVGYVYAAGTGGAQATVAVTVLPKTSAGAVGTVPTGVTNTKTINWPS